jgi:Lysine methyltransferase
MTHNRLDYNDRSDSDDSIDMVKSSVHAGSKSSGGKQEHETQFTARETTITVAHRTETSLPQVGLQVWNGALVLCDYILHNRHTFKSKVMEIGAGCGLVSILCGLPVIGCDLVIATDFDTEVLHRCQVNVKRNDARNVRVLKYDITEAWLPTSGPYGWSSQDVNAFSSCETLLAAGERY